MIKTLPLAPTHSYPSVGQCVYCGDNEGKLTKEHIVPRALHGNLVLPDASCNGCCAITSNFERRVLRGFLENGRRAMGISSRHKKHLKPDFIPTQFIAIDDSRWEENVLFEEGLHVVHLPVFIKPLMLGGVSKSGASTGCEIVAIDTLHIGDTKCAQRRGAVGVQIKTDVDTGAFVRMLAKVAHCYYIAEKGLFPLSQSPILPVIMGRSDDAKPWIGCLEDAQLTKQGSTALHLIDIAELVGADGSICSVVRIKLFSPNSGPTYAVVTRIQGP
ncbi:MAG: hypothetical protein ABI128_01715 [Rhodanobacter sp.]